MALSATSLEVVIKPDMQQRFQMEKKNWFPRDDTGIADDLMLLTVNDVCVSLFVGDCFPIAGISIKLAGLGNYLLLWIDISGTPSFTDLSRDDIGDHMKTYAEERNVLNQPRKSLIGSIYGEKIMVISPLLKWYVEHGLKVTQIH
jgi:hypothetical protein